MPTPPAGASVSAGQAEADPGFRRGDEKVEHSVSSGFDADAAGRGVGQRRASGDGPRLSPG